jgi:choline dehydrogenase-like flavoprotein
MYDWNFTTVAQTNLGGRSIDVNRGHVLGGSSALNYLCYDRASKAEYDSWGALGNAGWNWNSMIQAMVKSENFTGNDGDRHGRSGPIRTAYTRFIPDFLSAWKPALNKLGIPINDGGSLGGNPIGVMYQPTNIDTTRWTRSYSANSYLPLAGSNLDILTNTKVAKVDFAPQFKRGYAAPLVATGVTLSNGTKIAACKEVILSAGSIGSPGLLELSGIGQPAVLQAAGITPLLNLSSVGENYQDHVRISATYKLKDNFTTFDPLIYDSSGDFAQQQLQLWLDNKVSWLDYTSLAYGFMNLKQILNTTEAANLISIAQKSITKSSSVVDKKKIDFLNDDSVPQVEIIMEANYVAQTAYPGGKFITFLPTVMHPMSRGNVHINPADPQGKPVIDPKYFSNDYDIRALIAALKFTQKAAHTDPISSLWESEFEPGPSIKTDDQWFDFARKNVLSFYHPVGTCAMLPKENGGVVDSSLTVYGTSNLRVVDNSIMPVLISAHIQTAAYGIAEIAAGIIINDSEF